MSNVLSEDKRQQVLALGRLGWALRRIEQATGVRRETASLYLKAAGIAVRAPRTRRSPKAKPASRGMGVNADYFPQKRAATRERGSPKPASGDEVNADSCLENGGSGDEQA